MKTGPPIERHHDADLQLARAHDHPADHVGEHARSSPPSRPAYGTTQR